ncbi:MAG: hypothetical protein KC621_27705, partial [Myxococcales bacterium]|nr:hypothetical protein [Myxococcales bacterium]
MDVPAYDDFLPAALREVLLADTEPVPAVPGVRVARGLRSSFPETETDRALAVIAEVYRRTRASLARVLEQRRVDRAFVDDATRSFAEANATLDFRDPAYATVIGRRDAAGRVVVGPTGAERPTPRADVPTALRGDQVTLFGPPGNARMCIHAMNALHRRRPDEPAIVSALVEPSGMVPRWGADDEDSRTPIMASFLQAAENLSGCYAGTLSSGDLRLTDEGRSLPIKRIPGLALPDGSHWLDGQPLPLHLVDLVLHVWRQRHRPEALVLYVPKLENEEEA